ncbi:hypothetical protein [Malaciobacter molluscorum]|nr:hypothetical protein [Malaciobacter molluscorum]
MIKGIEIGQENNWTKQQYADAVNELRGETRQGLRKGKVCCKK